MKRMAAVAALLFAFLSPHRAVGVVVTNTGNSGAGSLRQAMLDANANPDITVVIFAIPGAGSHTIAPTSALPTISQPIVIDGFSQSGALRNTNPVGQPSNAVLKIFLSGASVGPTTPGIFASADADIFGLDVSGFSSYGMLLSQGSFTVEGCHIGVSGANALDGIYLDEGDGSHIGGAAGARNVISGNTGSGIAVNKTYNALIHGNYIGVGPDGVSNLGNGGNGIEMLDDAKFNTIGGAPTSDCADAPRTANVIAFNGGDGVTISDIGFVDAERNKIWSNSIHSNAGLGIDLLPNGVTANDANDADTGANRRQNFPTVIAADDSLVKLTLDMAPSTTFTVQFFRSAACDPSGNGEGETYLFQTALTTDAGGDANANVACGILIPPASMITATATDPLGNTSEFSPCVESKNTIAGSTRWVGVPDEDGDLLANIQFGSVTTGGNTFVTPDAIPPEPVPGSFLVGGTPTYYDIATTAIFNPTLGVDVCLHYDDASLPGDEDDVVLLHYDSALGDWVDVTTGRNPTTNFVCGHVSTLSPFVVAVPNPSTDIGDTPTPRTFALHHAVPNPFNPQTTIGFDLASSTHVQIDIFDASGRLVRTLLDESRAAGRWSVRWTGDDERGQSVASGVYFYRMRAGSFVETRKMVLLK